MIFSTYIIDADNAILLFEKVFKQLSISKARRDLGSGVIAEFFAAINTFIDEIQAAMRKGRDVSNMNRTLLAENSTVTMHYHPQARVLVSVISDAEDYTDILIAACKKIGERFWKKHHPSLKEFRKSMDKTLFRSFVPDVEMILRDGHVAEIFPKLEIPVSTLQRITLMGVITQEEFKVGTLLDGKSMSPLAIAKEVNKSTDDVMDILKKFESLDIIKQLKLPKF